MIDRNLAVTGLSKCLTILEGGSAAHLFASTFLIPRMRQLEAEMRSLSVTAAQRESAVIRWNELNDLLNAPRTLLENCHQILGSKPESTLDFGAESPI